MLPSALIVTGARVWADAGLMNCIAGSTESKSAKMTAIAGPIFFIGVCLSRVS